MYEPMGEERYCARVLGTYNYKYADQYVSEGGYASHTRVHERFATLIPDSIPSIVAGPLMCGGTTAFSPLYRNKIGKRSKVAIVGNGGIGHFGIIFAKHF